MSRKFVLAVAVAFVALAGHGAAVAAPAADPAITAIEAAYRPVGEMRALGDYQSRYYWRPQAQPGVVMGLYISGMKEFPQGVHVLSERERPLIFDGGCAVVHVTYRKAGSGPEFKCGGR